MTDSLLDSTAKMFFRGSLLSKVFMKTVKTLELKNSFHNTKIRVRYKSYMVPENQEATWWYIQFRASESNNLYPDQKSARSLMKRIKNKLCGSDTCTCGTVR